MEHRLFAFPAVMGCAIVLLAGCSTFSSLQSVLGGPSAPRGPSDKVRTVAAPEKDAPSPSIGAPKYELPVPDHPSIEVWVKRFSREKHKSFQAQLDRAYPYAVPAQRVFEQRGLPKDLIYVALIESGFSPKARSHASAVGMWQFIATTGKRFGLEQNKWVDERCHPMKAARAAADYLSFLYDTFGSWPLALAAYNAGEKAVQGSLVQSGLKTFWELADNGCLPAETRDYVPKVLAAVKIIRDPAHYGFYFDSKHYVQKHETVSIPGGVKLSWVGKKIGVPEVSLQDCNPELCQPVTPPGCSNYELCVPPGKGDDVLAALLERPIQEEESHGKAVPGTPKSALSHETKPGDSWSGLARKYKCSAKTLAALNGMTLSRPLKPGQSLKVPAGETSRIVAVAQKGANKDKPSPPGPGGRTASRPGQKPSSPFYYPIRQGDTLSSIADKFKISVKTLCAQNELKPSQKLIPGSLLAISGTQKDTVLCYKKSARK